MKNDAEAMDDMSKDELNRKFCGWLLCGGITMVGYSSLGTGTMEGVNSCGNLL